MEQSANEETKNEAPFKKPILVGKIGRLPRKIDKSNKKPATEIRNEDEQLAASAQPDLPATSQSLVEKTAKNAVPVPYKEPTWSGSPEASGRTYHFEVLKNGLIIENIDLTTRPFFVFGRSTTCDVCLQHPTISRYHTVLQYRAEKTDSDDAGFYVYDLDSTHGTFVNKNKLRPRVYVRIRVGHMLKLGCSTRSFILSGPEEDTEPESELSVTELKHQRQEELRKREETEREAEEERQRKEEEQRKKDEERGVDWGLGDDADEETDLSENPYAQTNNEELYLDNPKKALRGFFEREGLELEYDCSEQGIGQFLCKVELPLDDETGRPIFAEVVHKGKKKEAVVQCALEACRILDRHGVLRQATHESRKRKPKNWEENDYYDSDDDTYLDRTGTVERKREMRMNAKVPQQAETYESLVAKEQALKDTIQKTERELHEAQSRLSAQNESNTDEDSLDSYMKELRQSKPNKQAINKLKSDLVRLRQEHATVLKLVNVARPASLPPLAPPPQVTPSSSVSTRPTQNHAVTVYGKRKKVKLEIGAAAQSVNTQTCETTNVVSGPEVEEEEEEQEQEKVDEAQTAGVSGTSQPISNNTEDVEVESSSVSDDEEARLYRIGSHMLTDFEDMLDKTQYPRITDKHNEKLMRIMHNLKKLATTGDRMDVDWKMLEAKKRKVMKLIRDMNISEPDEKLEYKISSELNRILNELNLMTEQKFKVISKVKKMGSELKTITAALHTDLQRLEAEEARLIQSRSADEDGQGGQDEDKKKRKNQRRIQQRQDRAELERRRGYEEDARREDYSMWVPPSGQSGDGRTSLNDKYGY